MAINILCDIKPEEHGKIAPDARLKQGLRPKTY